jgi:hypothetical protein
MKCKNCNENEAIKYSKYSNGEFCSRECARAYSTKEKRVEINEKVKLILQKKLPKHIRYYNCDKCGENFTSTKIIAKGRYKHCDKCKRNRPHIKDLNDLDNILKCSSRTISKILKRGGVKCPKCNWGKTTLDLHHVTPKKNGGTDDNSNLIPLCPNCHRMCHEGQYSESELKLFTIDIIFSNWKEYYNNI